MKKLYDWQEIQRYHDTGNNRDACMRRFGFGISTWYKAAAEGRVRARVHRLQAAPVDWDAVSRYYDAGHTYAECRATFRFPFVGWQMAVKRGDVVPRRLRRPLDRVFTESKSRLSVKRRLLEEGILKNACDDCGITSWRGRPLSIQLDHRNGVRDDHRLQNLRMLCPNCHSQTPTFGTRNRKQIAPR